MEGWRGGSADAGTVSHLRRLASLRDYSQRLRAGLFFCRAYGAEETRDAETPHASARVRADPEKKSKGPAETPFGCAQDKLALRKATATWGGCVAVWEGGEMLAKGWVGRLRSSGPACRQAQPRDERRDAETPHASARVRADPEKKSKEPAGRRRYETPIKHSPSF
jgi:hypothetical protein